MELSLIRVSAGRSREQTENLMAPPTDPQGHQTGQVFRPTRLSRAWTPVDRECLPGWTENLAGRRPRTGLAPVLEDHIPTLGLSSCCCKILPPVARNLISGDLINSGLMPRSKGQEAIYWYPNDTLPPPQLISHHKLGFRSGATS